MPDPQLTPGVTRSGVTLDEICNTKWGTDARYVTEAMRKDVIAAYHFDIKHCPLTAYRSKQVHREEIDHLIPRELGGADDEKNLWPQCYERVMKDKSEQADGAHKKDQLENELHRRVCAAMSTDLLAEYQQKIATDWIKLYHEIYDSP